VYSDSKSVTGISAGLRKSTLHLLQGSNITPPTNSTELPLVYLGVVLSAGAPVVLSTEEGTTPAAVVAKTEEYRAAEAATLTKYGEWAEVKDAIQSSLMWSFMYDPRVGIVAPVTRNWAFGGTSQVLILYSYCTHTVLILYSYCTRWVQRIQAPSRSLCGS
jgi:hypothetical protein